MTAVQSWKSPQRPWGKYGQQYVYRCPSCAALVTPYYYCAANAIDWSLPAPRVGDRARPLKEKTLRRIQIGLEKFGRQELLIGNYSPGWARPVSEPAGVVTTSDHHALLTPPFTIETQWSHADGDRSSGIDAPLPTQTGQQGRGLVVPPFLVSTNYFRDNFPVDRAYPTQTSGNQYALCVPPFLTSFYGTFQHSGLEQPVPTQPSIDKHALVVPPFVMSYYTRVSGQQAAVSDINEALPTVPGRAVHYLAQPGETPAVEDCGFRMLQPHEIGAAMAFPADYVVLGNQREKVKQYGNAVTPPVMSELVRRCLEVLG